MSAQRVRLGRGQRRLQAPRCRRRMACDAQFWILALTCVVLPMIVLYTVFAYRVFWGKTRELAYGEPSLPPPQ